MILCLDCSSVRALRLEPVSSEGGIASCYMCGLAIAPLVIEFPLAKGWVAQKQRGSRVLRMPDVAAVPNTCNILGHLDRVRMALRFQPNFINPWDRN